MQTIRFIFLLFFPLIIYLSAIIVEKTIPQVLYRTGNSKLISSHEFQKVLNHTIQNNPEYLQFYFNHYERELFIKQYFPEYYDDYMSLIPGAYQADVFRLLILYIHGGIYNDIGNTYLKPIDTIINHKIDELILCVDIDTNQISNTFIASYPKHPIIKNMINLVFYNIKNKLYGCNNLDITGPKTLGRAFHLFFNQSIINQFKIGIYNIYNNNNNNNNYNIIFYKLIKYQNELYIQHYNTTELIINVKFRGYSQIIYKNIASYGVYWWARNVFINQSYNISILYESQLIKIGHSIYYIFQNKRINFPNNII